MWQLTGFFLGWLGEPGKGMALSTGEVKFKGMVTPTTKTLEYGVDFKRVMRGRLVLGIGRRLAEGRRRDHIQGDRPPGRPVQGSSCRLTAAPAGWH